MLEFILAVFMAVVAYLWGRQSGATKEQQDRLREYDSAKKRFDSVQRVDGDGVADRLRRYAK